MKENSDLLQMNLQFFASDSVETATETTTETVQETIKESTAEIELTAEEKLQNLMVENAKLKKSVDKTSSEAATYKKQLREKLSAEEVASQEKAEKEAERQEEIESMRRKIKITDLTNNYMDLGYNKDTANKAAIALHDGDIETLTKLQKEQQELIIKAREAEWLKTRPEANTGTGNSESDLFLKGFGK